MKPESARALMWSGAILIIVGPLGPRIGGAVILVIALALAVQLYPLYQKEQERYSERTTRSQSPAQPQPTAPR